MLKDEYNVPEGGYMSDCSVVEDALVSGENVIIEASPGMGKSFAILEALKAEGRPFIFVADSIPLAVNLGKRHSLPVFYKDSGHKPPDDPARFAFITIPHHVWKYPDSRVTVVVDEFHSIIADYGYKNREIDRMTLAFKRFKQVIGLSGTNFLDPEGFRRIKVQQLRPRPRVTVLGYRHLASAVYETVKANLDKKHFISVLDKGTTLITLRHAVSQAGIKASQVAVFNADVKDSEEVAEFLREDRWKEKKRVIFATYTQGFSIVDPHDYLFHIIPTHGRRHWVEHIVQVAQRHRRAEYVRGIYLYHNFPPEQEEVMAGDLNMYEKSLQAEAARRSAEYRSALGLKPDENPTLLQREMVARMEDPKYAGEEIVLGLGLSVRTGDQVNLVRPDLRVNDLQIVHNFQKKKAENAYARYQPLVNYLNLYAFDVVMGPKATSTALQAAKPAALKVEDVFKHLDACIAGTLTSDDNASLKELTDLLGRLRPHFTYEEMRDVIVAGTADSTGKTNPGKYRKAAFNRIGKTFFWLTSQDPHIRAFREDLYEKIEVGETFAEEDLAKEIRKITARHSTVEGLPAITWQVVRLFFAFSRRRQRDDSYIIEIESRSPLAHLPH